MSSMKDSEPNKEDVKHFLVPYRPDIDGLRALAIGLVILYHFFPVHLSGGFIGVDVFFVISGYLITGIVLANLKRGPFSFYNFFFRRIRRIFPALNLVLLVTLAIGYLTLLPEEFKQLGRMVANGAIFISNYALWKDAGYFDLSAYAKPLLNLWSLGVEEQFYLVWPTVLWFIYKNKFKPIYFISFLILTSFAQSIYFSNSDLSFAFYMLNTRFWELCLGAVLVILESSTINWRPDLLMKLSGRKDELISANANFMSFFGLFLILIGAFWINEKTIFPGWWALAPTIGACLIIASKPSFLNQKIFSNPLLVWFGLISFPLYLWHWPLLSIARINNGGDIDFFYKALLLVLIVFISWLTFRFIETPLKVIGSKRILCISLVAISLISGLSGLYVHKNNGLPGRFPGIESIDITEFSVEKYWASNSCHLQHEKGGDLFANPSLCIESGEGPSVFLWGDSFAASLYPGLKFNQANRNYRVENFTANACPPILGWDNPGRPFCQKINQQVISTIEKIHPDIVILFACWTAEPNSYPLQGLKKTIDTLKSIGISRVIVIGPIPVWGESLPRLAFNEFKNSLPHTVPVRMKGQIAGNIQKIDSYLSDMASNLNVEYFSAYKEFCNSEGCLVRVGDEKGSITAFDNAHLTPNSAQWLIEKMEADLKPLSELR